MSFELHPNLLTKDFIIDLPLSKVLLENDSQFPWIFLVPRRCHILKIMDLNQPDQLQLLKELDFSQKILWQLFDLVQLNVAAIGNKTPQLHLHVVGRRLTDPAWPQTVWDYPKKLPYTLQEKERLLQKLRSAFAERKE